jgi:putative N-acetyltransferase (TIGR04045 family)
MLEPTRPYGAPVRPFLSPLIRFGRAREVWQERAYWELRRAIFCEETALFQGSDTERDAHDAHALPIVAVAHAAGNPDGVVGIVRIYEASPGLWFGGRLGVEREYRRSGGVGAGLIDTAVRLGIAHGCQTFHATVLRENAAYFQRHHFSPLERIEVCGREHVLMRAELEHFRDEPARPRRSRLQERSAA